MPGTTPPVPEITEAMRPFFAGAKKRRLLVPRCKKCGMLRFPARETCNHCLASEVEWIEVSGRGTVFSYNIMHQVYHPWFADRIPYAVVIIELDEGVRMTSNMVDCPVSEIEIGMAVDVVFEDVSPDVTLPKFRPARW